MTQIVQSIGDRASGDTDDGNPVKIGAVGRTTNPAKVADTKRVNVGADVLGRLLVTPYQIRDLTSTGFATLTRVTETAIISGVASTFLDLKEITAINTTGVAVRVDIRSGTGGAILESLNVPANDMRTKQFNVPLPMSEVAQALTATWAGSTGEISDSPVVVSMIAINNT